MPQVEIVVKHETIRVCSKSEIIVKTCLLFFETICFGGTNRTAEITVGSYSAVQLFCSWSQEENELSVIPRVFALLQTEGGKTSNYDGTRGQGRTRQFFPVCNELWHITDSSLGVVRANARICGTCQSVDPPDCCPIEARARPRFVRGNDREIATYFYEWTALDVDVNARSSPAIGALRKADDWNCTEEKSGKVSKACGKGMMLF